MQPTPLYVVIGAMLGYISSILLSILHFPQVLQILHTFLKWLKRWLREGPARFNRWLWWRQYRPSWQITKYGALKIIFQEGKFHLQIPVDIKYKNRNKKYKAEYNCDCIELAIFHKGRGWEKQPYELSSNKKMNIPTLEASETHIVNYLFVGEMLIKPLVSNTARVKILGDPLGSIGEDTPYMNLYGKLKRVGRNKFKTKVLWVDDKE